MKKEEIKLSLILVVGGLGMIFCLFFLDIPFLPNLKYKSEVLDIQKYGRPFDRSSYQPHPLPKSSYKSNRTYSSDELMTEQISADIPGRGFQSEANGYSFGNGSTTVGSTFSQKLRSNTSSQGMGSGGGYYAYGKRGSSESRVSGQVSKGSMFAASELREPFSNSTPAPQRAPYAPNQGGTDPGGDPLGNPIPVGEGWGVLLLLAAGYAFIMKLRAKR